MAIGHSPCPTEDLEAARLALDAAAQSGRLALPSDLLLPAGAVLTGIEPRGLDRRHVPDDQVGLDIGPETADRYAAELGTAATVFWTGPMGRFELPAFAGGTRAIADAVASTSAITVVGGGETVQAMRAYGLQDRVSHLSTGGEVAVKLLEGRELPGLQALRELAVNPGP